MNICCRDISKCQSFYISVVRQLINETFRADRTQPEVVNVILDLSQMS